MALAPTLLEQARDRGLRFQGALGQADPACPKPPRTDVLPDIALQLQVPNALQARHGKDTAASMTVHQGLCCQAGSKSEWD